MAIKKSRKREQFTEVYSTYFPIIYSVIRTKVDDDIEAEDICQEVFVRLFQKFDDVDNYRRWLFSALRLVVLEFYRSKYNNSVNIDDVWLDISMIFVNGFRDSRIIIEETIEECSENLTDSDRALFELIAFNNFTYKSTAEQLGITRRQVEYKYTMIVKQIIENLKKKGIHDLKDLL